MQRGNNYQLFCLKTKHIWMKRETAKRSKKWGLMLTCVMFICNILAFVHIYIYRSRTALENLLKEWLTFTHPVTITEIKAHQITHICTQFVLRSLQTAKMFVCFFTAQLLTFLFPPLPMLPFMCICSCLQQAQINCSL